MTTDGRGKEPCQFVRVWNGLVRAKSSVLDSFERELQERYGLSLTEYAVLLRLAEADRNRLRMIDLADSVLLSKSGATRLVDRLAARGLVERSPCAEDRRAIWASLTEAGLRSVEETRSEYERVIRRSLATKLSAADARTLASLLEKLLDFPTE